jgi:prepilin-type N-terminal cleavage/methylation domain-containing protein
MIENRGRKQTGFTIVELLVVIVVVGILAAIVIVSYGGVQTNARATAAIDGISRVEKAFKSMAAEQNRSTWWPDTTFTGANNPNISDIITSTPTMKAYLPQVPVVAGLVTTWQYDNDGDTRLTTTCSTPGSEGSDWMAAILVVGNLTNAVAQSIDNSIDDGDLSCGKVRASNAARTGILYQLGYTQDMK